MYPCTRAMVTDVTTVKSDATVQEVLNIFKEKNIRNVPVVDDNGAFVGLMGLHQILIALLPTAATMEHGLPDLSFVSWQCTDHLLLSQKKQQISLEGLSPARHCWMIYMDY